MFDHYGKPYLLFDLFLSKLEKRVLVGIEARNRLHLWKFHLRVLIILCDGPELDVGELEVGMLFCE